MKTKQQVIEEAIEAIKCLEQGKPHPRIINYMERSVDERLRRASLQPKRAPVVIDEAHHPVKPGEFTFDPDSGFQSYGPGGAKRSD